MCDLELLNQAIIARKLSYSPYSNFMVGAALLTKSGRVYLGCNIENISFSATNCAERTAFFKAISDGEKEFDAIAIVGAKKDASPFTTCMPCGVCLQVMSEFCDFSKFRVIVANGENHTKSYLLSELLPQNFNAQL